MVSEIQLAIIEALSKRGGLDGIDNPRSYLERIAKRTAWKMARRCEVEENTRIPIEGVEVLEKHFEGEDFTSSCERDVEERALNRLLIEELLRHLSSKHAAFIYDLFFRGYDIASDYMVNTYGKGDYRKVQKMYQYILKKLRKVAGENGLQP